MQSLVAKSYVYGYNYNLQTGSQDFQSNLGNVATRTRYWKTQGTEFEYITP